MRCSDMFLEHTCFQSYEISAILVCRFSYARLPVDPCVSKHLLVPACMEALKL